jgi:hypothetical protein
MKNLILGILLISISTTGQKLNFDIHNTSLSEYIRMEETLGAERIPTTSNHISFTGEAQPIKFLRKENAIPDLVAYYFFKKSDSSMSYVLYEWDVNNFEKQDNNQKSKKFEKALIEKYKSLKKEIAADLGQPKIKSNYSNIARLDPHNLFEETSAWQPNDTTEIEMYITSSNYYEKRGVMTINPVHRIRLYIRNKSKAEEKAIPKLDNERLTKLENLTMDFFKTLKSKELQKSREYLSNLVKEKVTDEQLNSLIGNMNVDRNLELFFSGVQMGFDGSNYTLLQYKYTDDKSSPPRELIKVIIDKMDKIIGIQPIKLQSKITD